MRTLAELGSASSGGMAEVPASLADRDSRSGGGGIDGAMPTYDGEGAPYEASRSSSSPGVSDIVVHRTRVRCTTVPNYSGLRNQHREVHREGVRLDDGKEGGRGDLLTLGVEEGNSCHSEEQGRFWEFERHLGVRRIRERLVNVLESPGPHDGEVIRVGWHVAYNGEATCTIMQSGEATDLPFLYDEPTIDRFQERLDVE